MYTKIVIKHCFLNHNYNYKIKHFQIVWTDFIGKLALIYIYIYIYIYNSYKIQFSLLMVINIKLSEQKYPLRSQ